MLSCEESSDVPKIDQYMTDVSSLSPVNLSNPTKIKKLKQNDQETAIEGTGKSPYPKLDHFINTQINWGGIQGDVRSWVSFPQRATMIYNISKNRFCFNLQRAHKSNHVFLVVDLYRKSYTQKCYDPGN